MFLVDDATQITSRSQIECSTLGGVNCGFWRVNSTMRYTNDGQQKNMESNHHPSVHNYVTKYSILRIVDWCDMISKVYIKHRIYVMPGNQSLYSLCSQSYHMLCTYVNITGLCACNFLFLLISPQNVR